MTAAPYFDEKRNIVTTPAAESGPNVRPTTPSASASPTDNAHAPEASFQIEPHDDCVIAHSTLLSAVRGVLLKHYFEAGQGPCGGTVWWPREVRDV